jgi:putative FmdB family regulatory protein
LPTYEYHCDSCDKNFDAVQSFHDDPLTSCPTCGEPVRKVFGNVGIVFKGSGFYKTDSRNGAVKSSEGSEPTPASDPGSKGSEPANDGKSSPASSESPATPSTTPPPTSPEKPSKASKEKSSDAGKAPAS